MVRRPAGIPACTVHLRRVAAAIRGRRTGRLAEDNSIWSVSASVIHHNSAQ